jgi:hypothetical protein
MAGYMNYNPQQGRGAATASRLTYGGTGGGGGGSYSNFWNKYQPPALPATGNDSSQFWDKYKSPFPAYSQNQQALGNKYQQNVWNLTRQLQGGNQPQINQHLSNLMGGQRQSLQDYVRQAAGAGIQRGGMNVAGGGSLGSQLAMQATRGLAGQYGQNYNQATAAANQDRASLQALLGQMQSGAQSSYGNQMSGYQGGLNELGLQRTDYGRDQSAQLAKDLAQYQGGLTQMGMQREDYGKDLATRQANQQQQRSSLSPAERKQQEDWANFQQEMQRKQMLEQLQQMQQATRQGKLTTKQKELDLSGNEFKQQAWMGKMSPYLQALQSNVGGPSSMYGGMNNMQLADAARATNAWSGYRQYR